MHDLLSVSKLCTSFYWSISKLIKLKFVVVPIKNEKDQGNEILLRITVLLILSVTLKYS